MTKMWKIKEAPGLEIEETPGAWVVWNGEEVIAMCGKDSNGGPVDLDLIYNLTKLDKWTPIRVR